MVNTEKKTLRKRKKANDGNKVDGEKQPPGGSSTPWPMSLSEPNLQVRPGYNPICVFQSPEIHDATEDTTCSPGLPHGLYDNLLSKFLEDPAELMRESGFEDLVHTFANQRTNLLDTATATSLDDNLTSDGQPGGLSMQLPELSDSTSLTSLTLKKLSPTAENALVLRHNTSDILKCTSTQGHADDTASLIDDELNRANDHYKVQWIPLFETTTCLLEEKGQWERDRGDWEARRRVLEDEKNALQMEKQQVVKERSREIKTWRAHLEAEKKKLESITRDREEERKRHTMEIEIKENECLKSVRKINTSCWELKAMRLHEKTHFSTEHDKLMAAKEELAEACSELIKVIKQNNDLQGKVSDLGRDLRQHDECFNEAMNRWKRDLEAERTKREEVQQRSQDTERFQDQVKTLEARITHATSAEAGCRAEMEVLRLEKERMGAELTKAQDSLRHERIRADGAERMVEEAKREGGDARAHYEQQLGDLTCQHKTEYNEANDLIMKHKTLLSETEARATELTLKLEDSVKVTENLLQKAKEEQARMQSQLAESERNAGVLATELGVQHARNAAMGVEVEKLQASVKAVKAVKLQRDMPAQEMAVSQETKGRIQTPAEQTDPKISTLQLELDSAKQSLADALKTIKTHEAAAVQLVTQRSQLENELKAVNPSFTLQNGLVLQTKLEEAHSLLLAEKIKYEAKLVTAELEFHKNASIKFGIERAKLTNDHKRLLKMEAQEAAAARRRLEDEHKEALELELTRYQTEIKGLQDAHQETLRGLRQAMAEAAGHAITTVFETFNAN